MIKIELNSGEIEKLLKSPEIASRLKEVAEKVAESSGGETEKSYTGKTRVRVRVHAENNGDDARNRLIQAVRGKNYD